MAIYHLSAKIVKRSAGQSAVNTAAYVLKEKLKDERLLMNFNFSQKQNEVVYAGTLIADNVPAKLQDAEKLWNDVEKFESAKTAQLARRLDIALPKELSRQEQIELTNKFMAARMGEGMCCTFAIHDKGDGNPHIDAMFTLRRWDDNKGSWGAKARKEYVLDKNGQRILLGKDKQGKNVYRSKKVDLGWNDKSYLEKWRREWAELANQSLANANQSARIDNRSLAEQQIRREAQIHTGTMRGASDRRKQNEEIRQRNSRPDKSDEAVKARKRAAYWQRRSYIAQKREVVEKRQRMANDLGCSVDKLGEYCQANLLGEDVVEVFACWADVRRKYKLKNLDGEKAIINLAKSKYKEQGKKWNIDSKSAHKIANKALDTTGFVIAKGGLGTVKAVNMTTGALAKVGNIAGRIPVIGMPIKLILGLPDAAAKGSPAKRVADVLNKVDEQQYEAQPDKQSKPQEPQPERKPTDAKLVAKGKDDEDNQKIKEWRLLSEFAKDEIKNKEIVRSI